MVAASKMRKAQDRMLTRKTLCKKNFASDWSCWQSVMLNIIILIMEKREIKRVGYIIVTTDRGLCGGLNTNLLKARIKAH